MFCWLALGVLASTAVSASAQDSPPYLLNEPGEYTDVIDAFEPNDPLDVNVSLGFVRSSRSTTIQREASDSGDTVAGRYLEVAQSAQVTNALSLELDVGLWRDLMAFARLPLVLSDTRTLRPPAAASCNGAACREQHERIERVLGRDQPGSGSALFSPDYDSATRSGVPHFDLGVAWGVTNQVRRPWLPTWVVTLEGRFGVGELLAPCSSGMKCGKGINRGTTRLELGSRWSYRLRFVEPYLGVRYALEWATGASERFSPHGDQPGYQDTSPPRIAETTLGATLIAWEERGRSQRFAIDVRGRAAYVTAGRDYSPLFDALGTSLNPQLSVPYATHDEKNVVRFNGLTQVDAYARLGVELAAAMQAARYVRFRLGVALWHETPHLITDGMPCAAGKNSCPAGEVNALYRPIIDLPGQRFRSGANLTFDLFAHATGQF